LAEKELDLRVGAAQLVGGPTRERVVDGGVEPQQDGWVKPRSTDWLGVRRR
jgi:hypothetical protein